MFIGPHIVTDGLVLNLDAANTKSYPTTGTAWTDLSGNGNNGTLTNGPTFSSANGGSIVFDGTNDYVRTTTNALPAGTSLFTLSFWIYIVNITGNFGPPGKGLCVFSGNAGGTMECILLPEVSEAGPPYTFYFGRYGGSTTGNCSFTLNMPLLTWHNLVIVRDGTASQKIYLNGSLIGTGNVSNSFAAGTLHIGGAPFNNDYTAYLNGRLSNVLDYNRALTAAEILQNYNATKSRFNL